MSLEASIAELTAAVRALTDVLLNPVQPQVISTPVEVAHVEEVKEEIAAIDAAIAEEPDAFEEQQAPAELDAENESFTYEDVKKATIALSAKSKAEAVKLLADYGVKKATELPLEAWNRYVAEAKARAA